MAEIISFPDGERLTPPEPELRSGDHIRVRRSKVCGCVVGITVKGLVLVQQTGGVRRLYRRVELERL